jgi:hypothetical protein
MENDPSLTSKEREHIDIMSSKIKHQRWVDIAVFENIIAGKNVEALLTGKGFEARTYDDKWFRYFLFLRPPQITYRVQVRQNDITNVEAFLNAEAPDALKKAIHCPSCDSLQVSYPQMTRKFILPTIVLHLGIIFHVTDHECYCEHCHFTWNLSGEKTRPDSKPTRQFPFSKL